VRYLDLIALRASATCGLRGNLTRLLRAKLAPVLREKPDPGRNAVAVSGRRLRGSAACLLT